MTIRDISISALPSSWHGMQSSLSLSGQTTYILFAAADDPSTGQPWCSDYREALPVLEKYFNENDEAEVARVKMEKDKWKQSENAFKTNYNVKALPTLARYTENSRSKDGMDVTFLVENDCKSGEKVAAFCK